MIFEQIYSTMRSTTILRQSQPRSSENELTAELKLYNRIQFSVQHRKLFLVGGGSHPSSADTVSNLLAVPSGRC